MLQAYDDQFSMCEGNFIQSITKVEIFVWQVVLATLEVESKKNIYFAF